MEPAVYTRFREALRMLSFRRHGMAAELLEELSATTDDPDCRFWLAYVYRRMRRYDRALELLEALPDARDELERVRAEHRSYELFREALELQGQGQDARIRELLERAQSAIADDPDLRRWIEEELELYRASVFERR
jgi:tetratricopeptide (TPR) repeat protein